MRSLLILFLLTGCVTKTTPTPQFTAHDQRLAVRNQSYSLLYSLLSDEKNVSKLLLIKKEAPDFGGLVQDISKVAGAAAAKLERWSKSDSHLHLDMPGLPLAEKQTRDSISKTKAKELISKSGDKFEIRILLSQAEALTYGAHLAIVTRSHEDNAERKEALLKISEDLQALHQRLIDLVHARWQTAPVNR